MTESPPARPLLLSTCLALAAAMVMSGAACSSSKGASLGMDASGSNDASIEASAGTTGEAGASGGAAMTGGAGGSAGGTGGAAAAAGKSGGAGGTAGASGGPDAGSDAAGPDLSACPIRNCVQRFVALQAGCAAFGVACVKEVHGAQTNYCFANGVRTYVDGDGATALATMIRADGHTCYSVFSTYSTNGPTTGAIRDPDENTIMLETDSADDKTITFTCNGVQWVEDGVSCGAGGINAYPFFAVDCPKTTGQMCLRP